MPLLKAFTYTDAATVSAASVNAKRENVAWRDTMKVIATGIPDPAIYARHLPLDIAAILLGASGTGAACRVHHGRVHELRRMGLVEFGGTHLTAFGFMVRKALREEDA
jgi:hypothetical protein